MAGGFLHRSRGQCVARKSCVTGNGIHASLSLVEVLISQPLDTVHHLTLPQLCLSSLAGPAVAVTVGTRAFLVALSGEHDRPLLPISATLPQGFSRDN